MSDIENRSTSKRVGPGKKSIRKATRVDLTPMVDLGFLLITFFVFTTQLTQPTVMNLNMPIDKEKITTDICESCVLTVVLEKNNIIRYYQGMAGINTELGSTDYSSMGIRNIILQKRASVKKLRGSVDDFVIIVKSMPESSFQNFVDMLDEITISNVKHYYVAEPDALDETLLRLK
jgi:biopolymer transport protein ExbD